MYWQTKHRKFDLRRGPLVMGIVNVTVDSFSDGGKCLDPAAAVTQALRMEAAGADIIDIGGESTRPGAEPISAEEELARVLPVIRTLAPAMRGVISVDTYKPEVAKAALAAGADIINDVTGLRDPAMEQLAAESGAGIVIMHMQGEPRTMQQAPSYEDVAREIREFFRQSFTRALSCGMKPEQIVFDPGIGFGKTSGHNLTLIRKIGELRVEDRPLLLGVSRKGFLAKVTGASTIEERIAPTVALTALARAAGVNIFRVHDVPENVRALKITDAVLNAP
ncbi:MAG TPA: dihydropteroate synthase [Chthoniobacteraceae bacterium]|jgi:dihydropteroate synthase|nr:dihydropteroate synthase [Chthoniobacteraceae bacterium]